MENLTTNNNLRHNPVGQLAKNHFPTPKAPAHKGPTVGGQQNKKPRTHTRTCCKGFFNLNDQKRSNPNHFRLYNTSQKNFIRTVPLLFEHMDNTKVVFHNRDYVNEVFETYYAKQAHLFLDWVKTFAIIRSSCRTQLTEDVILSEDEDFLTALNLFRIQGNKAKRKPMHLRKKVWKAIVKYYPDKPFKCSDIVNASLIQRTSVSNILFDLKIQGKIKQCVKKQSNNYLYQLIKPSMTETE